MRIKLIAVNALIVAIVGLLALLLVRSSLSSATSNKDQLSTDAQDNVNGAAARLQLDGLRAERRLGAATIEQGAADALGKATPSARGEAATKHCDDLVSQMKNGADLRAQRADPRRPRRRVGARSSAATTRT